MDRNQKGALQSLCLMPWAAQVMKFHHSFIKPRSTAATHRLSTGYVTVLPTWTQLPADWDEEWTLVEKHLEHTTEQKILLQPSQI